MTTQTNRRQFLEATGVAGIGFFATAGYGLGQAKERDRLRIACIGVGGKGSSDTDHAGEVGNVVALCDIDDRILNGKAARFPRARKFHDFRRMFDDMGREIDAVVVSTPDHTHAPAAALAIRAGKHVYCQKPLTHSVHEARTLRQLAQKHRVCTQMGNQGTAANGLRESAEIVRSGALGTVREVHVWTNRPVWPQAPRITARPTPSDPPAHVHWDLWIGPAPTRPYSGQVMYNKRPPYHDFNWRGWWDFGTGALGDMACHTANVAFMALRLGLPTSISAESGPVNNETYPEWARVTFEFPAVGDRPAVRFIWHEGRRDGRLVLPPEALLHGQKFAGSGCLMVGDKGTLYSPDDYGSARRLLPEKAFEGFRPPAATLPRNNRGDLGMKQEWVEAITKNDPRIAVSNFDYASVLTEAILLGNAAIKAGKRLEYNGETGEITNDRAANASLRREYRAGWSL